MENPPGTPQFHYLTRELMSNDHPIRIWLVGAGATGTAFARQLARIQAILEQLNICFDVTVFDGDVVQKHNVGKQNFFTYDMIDMNKAYCLTQIVNNCYGTVWTAYTAHLREKMAPGPGPDIIIGAVDTIKARKIIHYFFKHCNTYWLDLGNDDHYGQAILGFRGDKKEPSLPSLLDIYPDLKDGEEKPSCSVFESIQRQSLFINDIIATLGANLLFDLLYLKQLNYHGYYFSFNNNTISKLWIPSKNPDKPKLA